MRISDWSSDVCSSDLGLKPSSAGKQNFLEAREVLDLDLDGVALVTLSACESGLGRVTDGDEVLGFTRALDRKSVVSGKSVSVRVDLGGRRIIKKQNTNRYTDSQA